MEFPRRVKKLIAETRIRWANHGKSLSIKYAYNQIFHNFLRRQFLGQKLFKSRHPYSDDWDLLVILDACRYDMLREIQEDYPFLQNVERRTSLGGRSAMWMERMFSAEYRDEIGDTAYITANPHSDIVLGGPNVADPKDFALLDEVWQYGWDSNAGTVPAETVTDRAVANGRSTSAERVVVHYMQPHFPSIPNPEVGGHLELSEVGDEWKQSIWDQLKEGQVSTNEVWEAYRANLAYVLEKLHTLLSNFDAETAVITADHGNAVGDGGFFGHGGYPTHSVWEIPWATTRGVDRGTFDPTVDPAGDTEMSLEDRLQSLGYLSE